MQRPTAGSSSAASQLITQTPHRQQAGSCPSFVHVRASRPCVEDLVLVCHFSRWRESTTSIIRGRGELLISCPQTNSPPNTTAQTPSSHLGISFSHTSVDASIRIKCLNLVLFLPRSFPHNLRCGARTCACTPRTRSERGLSRKQCVPPVIVCTTQSVNGAKEEIQHDTPPVRPRLLSVGTVGLRMQ